MKKQMKCLMLLVITMVTLFSCGEKEVKKPIEKPVVAEDVKEPIMIVQNGIVNEQHMDEQTQRDETPTTTTNAGYTAYLETETEVTDEEKKVTTTTTATTTTTTITTEETNILTSDYNENETSDFYYESEVYENTEEYNNESYYYEEIPCEPVETQETAGEEVFLASKTLYSGCDQDSWYNICLALQNIDGMYVYPWTMFSWADSLGGNTLEQGYILAKGYSGNEVIMVEGGGVCFASTLLFQTAREVGCEIIERHDHSLPVSYAARGDEAAVSYGSMDMKFANNTDMTLKFYAYTEGRYATISCYAIS